MKHTLAFAALITLLAAPPAPTQDNTSLEQQIAQVLDRHPEVLIAKAKVAQAEAEYRLVRMRIAQEVIEKRGALALERARVEQLQKRLQLEGPEPAKADERNALIEAMSRIAQLESAARLGAGVIGPASADPTPVIRVRPDPPENYSDVLALPVHVGFEQATIPTIAAALAKQVSAAANGNPPLQIVVDTQGWSDELGDIADLKVDLERPGSVTLRHAFEILADVTPLRFVLRDYGVLITTEQRAAYIDAATIPADLPLLGH